MVQDKICCRLLRLPKAMRSPTNTCSFLSMSKVQPGLYNCPYNKKRRSLSSSFLAVSYRLLNLQVFNGPCVAGAVLQTAS